MQNKNAFIKKMIFSIFTFILLIYLFIKAGNVVTRIIIIPFLICCFAMLGNNIFLAMNKTKYAKVFNKLYIISFLLYWFGFLIYWCYMSYIDKNYFLLFFSLPFWLVGFYVTYKFLFKKKNSNFKLKIKVNFKIIVSGILIMICLISGIAMLYSGIKDRYKLNNITKNYITIDGYFSNYDVYSSNEEGETYKLTYIYTVNDQKYSVSTDYGTNYIPEKNSISSIKYNPENPQEAIIVGTNSQSVLILVGFFFTVVAFAFILIGLSILGYFDKLKIDIVGIYIGLIFLTVGIGIIMFQNGTTASLIQTVKSLGLWILVPIIFICLGAFQIIRCLFFKHNEI